MTMTELTQQEIEFVKKLYAEKQPNQPKRITKTFDFEIYTGEYPKEKMSWNEAMGWAKSLGDGWRLLSRIEWLIIYENIDQFPHLSKGSYYWTCDNHNNDCAWLQGLRDGKHVSYNRDGSAASLLVGRGVNHLTI